MTATGAAAVPAAFARAPAWWRAGLALAAGLLLGGTTRAAAPEEAPRDGVFAEITTPRGTIVCELFFREAPLTTSNFVGLAEGTLGPPPAHPFYDQLKFHRVVPGFVVQGGDPLGTGEGGPGYQFPDEFAPGLRHDAAGVLSMANSGPDTNGSQFFLTLAPVRRLDYLHSVFGRTVAGVDVLPLIRAGDPMRVKIVRRGAAAAAFRPTPASFAALAARLPRAAPAAFVDVNGLLPTEPPRAAILAAKLENFARFQNQRLILRLYEKFGDDPAAPDPAAWTKNEAATLRLRPADTLVAYFAADNRVQLWSPRHPYLAVEAPAIPAATGGLAAPEAAAELKRNRLTAVNEILDSVIAQIETPPHPPGSG